MMSTLRTLSPVVCIVAAHLGFLAYGAMLGCSFSNRVGGEVDDDMDHQNFYTCGCRCDTPVTETLHVPAAFDDAESVLRADDNDGATDLDLGAALVGLRFVNLAIPPGAEITFAALAEAS